MLLGAGHNTAKSTDDRILVVVQMSGGNDGLNTVIPYADDEYYKNRFTLAIGKNSVRKLNDHVGLHPSLDGLKVLLDRKQMSIIQGVGYAQPNRSHFESMDLWHTAHQIDGVETTGWLGNTAEKSFSKIDLPAIHFGSGLQPLALKTKHHPVPSIQSMDQFELKLFRNRKLRNEISRLVKSKPQSDNDLLGYVYESANVAIETSHRIEELKNESSNEFRYPQTSLGQNLNIIAQLIGSGLSTRIYYTSIDGFDTHSNQADAHSGLLKDLGDSIGTFMQQITAQGNDQRVCVFSFSEFGRRVRENASRGTDHGTAAPVFVFGGNQVSHLHGEHPSLTDLEGGDLKYQIDYRRVYADLLANWLQVDPTAMIPESYLPLGIFRADS
ncbi:MAG: DUF1501 domain-containing protein [Planctomycetota bacterium]